MPSKFGEGILSNNKNLILALDLGGTNFRLALANEKGEILRYVKAPVESPNEPEQAIKQIKQSISDMLSETERASLRGMGIAIAGLVTQDTGVLLTSPNLLVWYNTPVKDIFEKELNLPVWVGNDANLAALGEHRFGAGRGCNDLVYITVSTGIGGGVITGGRLLLGSCGFAAEVGHMTIDINGPKCNCGNTGCLEMLASGTAIARMAVDRLSKGKSSLIPKLVDGDLREVNAEVVERAARMDDDMAKEIMHTAGINLGIGVVNLVHLFNPELIIIGGGVSKSGDLIFEPVRRVVAERVMPDIKVRITTPELGDNPGLLGAVALVLDNT
jgi:glucokinase